MKRLNDSHSYHNYYHCALEIDKLLENTTWILDPHCQLYEYDLIHNTIKTITKLLQDHNIFELMFILRGSISRNKFGLLHEGLFEVALSRTK